jgi:arylsulfatase A-like enzyme
MPHVPIFASERFRGKSELGLYGDVIMEIDWSVGEILAAVKRTGMDDRTMMIFASDNGPWLPYGEHAGKATPFRGGLGSTLEGGVRVPAIFRWPGKIPAGRVCHELASTIDILPTIACLADAELPEGRTIDGKDIWPLLAGEDGAKAPHKALYFYRNGGLQAVRSGKWKLFFPHRYRELEGPGGKGGKRVPEVAKTMELSLFDLDNDPGERKNVADKHPDIVRRLQFLAQHARETLGDAMTGQKGNQVRPLGQL